MARDGESARWFAISLQQGRKTNVPMVGMVVTISPSLSLQCESVVDVVSRRINLNGAESTYAADTILTCSCGKGRRRKEERVSRLAGGREDAL
jgi:hypothetical protein